jgi:outer membrane protein W
MKFNQIVVVIAISMLTVNAFAETATQTTVQEQKTVVSTQSSVSDSPVVTPAAPIQAPAAPVQAPAAEADKKIDAIKKTRIETEQKNDSKIVEKLEKTRLDDEKNLSEKIDSADLKEAQKKDDDVKIQKVEIINPSAPVATTSAATIKEEKQDEEKRIWYAGIGAGSVIYNGNTEQKSNFGIMVGTMLDEHVAVEGSFIYSSFSLNNYWGGVNNGVQNGLFGSMDQYDISGTLKYYVLDSKQFRPYVGGSADYIYRQYKDRYINGNNYFSQYDNYTTGQNTNALNAALLAGIDVKLTDRLLIGGEFKYSLPVYAQDNGLITQSYVMAYAKPLEQTSFTSWLVSLKFLF